jgi:hypothetical protein
MFLQRPADLQRAFDRRFRAIVKDERHPVTGRNLDQSTRRFRGAELIRATDDLVERLEQSSLFVNQQLGVADDVYKQDMRDLQLNFFLNLGGHLVMRQLTNLNFGALRRDQRQHVTSRFAFRG